MSDSGIAPAAADAAHTLERRRDHDPAHSSPTSDQATGVPSAEETVGGAEATGCWAADAVNAPGSVSNASACFVELTCRSSLDSLESDNDGSAPDGGLTANDGNTPDDSSAALRGVPMGLTPALGAVPPGSTSARDLPMSSTPTHGTTPGSPGVVDRDAGAATDTTAKYATAGDADIGDSSGVTLPGRPNSAGVTASALEDKVANQPLILNLLEVAVRRKVDRLGELCNLRVAPGAHSFFRIRAPGEPEPGSALVLGSLFSSPHN